MYNSKQKQLAGNHTKQPHNITIGTVVSASDPQQMGRLKIVCPKWGDTFDGLVDDLPWASYISPFGGDSAMGARGPGLQESVGTVAYGFWAIPKIGSQVLVMLLDDDPMFRIYIGSLYSMFTPHTMPHGRFKYDGHPATDADGSTPYGPFTSSEKPIEPLATNLKEAFGNAPVNYEWQTRAADYQVSAIGPQHVDYSESTASDDYQIVDKLTDWTSTQGYEATRYDETEQESKVVSLTSPGFHALSMDDRIENCRVRLRTTSGHQILMDDTNERIYISTAKGNNWIEMDQDGNIDVFSNTKLNIHAVKDVNITSDESVRIYGKAGIHLVSGADIRLQSKDDIHINSTAGNLRIGVAKSIYESAQESIHTLAGKQILLASSDTMHLLSGGETNISAADTVNINTAGDFLVTASTVHHNGPTAAVAKQALDSAVLPAKWTNRVPQHEPFARTMTKNDFTHDPELPYTSSLVNRIERGRKIIRGLFWRR